MINSRSLIVSVAEEMNPSRRSTMEDVHVVHQPGSWNCHDSEWAFLGVYDGHGGRDIVNFLEESLSKNVATELNHVDDPDENDVHMESRTYDISKRIERAFLITDIESRMEGITSSGATVCMCLIKRIPLDQEGSIRVLIHAANVGDARAVLYHPGVVTNNQKSLPENHSVQKKFVSRLTRDHRANDLDEIQRIEKAGGFVFRDRVLGILAVSRSIGDHGMKDFVISQPFQNTVDFLIDGTDKKNDSFVILACDGVWDVFTDAEAVNFVLQCLAENSSIDKPKATKENVAECLCNEAMRRGSTDNITVVVAWLN